jgi:thermitase
MAAKASLAFPNQPNRFPDNRTDQERGRERSEIQKQVAHLTKLPQDKLRQRKVLDRLARSRQARGLPPFAELPDGNVPPLTLLELLVRTDDLRRWDVRRVIDAAGLSPVPVSVLGGGLTRLRPRRPERFLAVVEAVKGLPVFPNYLVPEGGWTKGEGGPEPTAARPTWREPGERRIQVAVVDTGLGVRTDEWLRGLINPEIDPLYPAPPNPTLGLAAGHGTFAAGIVQQVEPSVDLRMYRALDIDGVGDDLTVGAKIEQAAVNGAQIINLSLGTQTAGNFAPLGMQAGIRRAIAINPSILIVCAAGNYGDDTKVWPAAFSLEFPGNVVAVAGLNAHGEPAAWSTHDDPDSPEKFVQISTIAEGIVSTYVDGTEDIVVENPPDVFKLNDWAIWAGNSFAAPQITGAVASICLTTGQVPTAAFETLKTRGTEMPGYGVGVRILPGT